MMAVEYWGWTVRECFKVTYDDDDDMVMKLRNAKSTTKFATIMNKHFEAVFNYLKKKSQYLFLILKCDHDAISQFLHSIFLLKQFFIHSFMHFFTLWLRCLMT